MGWATGRQDVNKCVVAALLMALLVGVAIDRLPVGLGVCVDEERGGKGWLADSPTTARRLQVCICVAPARTPGEGLQVRTAATAQERFSAT